MTNSSDTSTSPKYPTKTRGGAIKIEDTYYQEPPDGGWGWVIVLAVWIDNMCVLGMLKSFPVLYGAFKEQPWEDATPETLNFKISLISSLSLSMRATCAPFAAALTNKYNERTTVSLGAFLIIFWTFYGAICDKDMAFVRFHGSYRRNGFCICFYACLGLDWSLFQQKEVTG